MSMETANYEAMAANDLLGHLDQAIAALTVLDADRLEGLVLRLTEVGEGESLRSLGVDFRRDPVQIRQLQGRQRVLGMLVENTGGNLTVLRRLHDRGVAGGAVWAR